MKEAKQDASSNATKVVLSPLSATTPNIIRGVNMWWDKSVSFELIKSLHWSFPWTSLFQAQSEWKNKLWEVCWKSEPGASDSGFKSFALINKVLEFEKWMDLLQKRAIKYPRCYDPIRLRPTLGLIPTSLGVTSVNKCREARGIDSVKLTTYWLSDRPSV